MKPKYLIYLTLVILVGSSFLPGCDTSAIDCDQISHWSHTDPPINQQHVFCGEWNNRKNRPSGFHSRPAGENPATVGRLKITQQPYAKGLYGVRWSFVGHPDREKFSSMFPDTCNREQILKSIVYAAKHQIPCPHGAPRWAKCGPNQPTKGGQEYCQAADNSIFTIAFATLKNSDKINTAFPVVE
ncbi:MAG: EndoU domain-containing protein [Desulfobacterales bacterium]